MQELVSYAIGCMMGRYSLDEPGLIYAHSGNEGFDPSRYTTFPADDDGILPLTDTEWFDDDTANRLIEFISVAWDAAHLEENLTFLADNLSPKKNEPSRDTHSPLSLRQLLQGPPTNLQEPPHLLAPLKWQAESLPMSYLSSSV